jgi:hypothetical protein
VAEIASAVASTCQQRRATRDVISSAPSPFLTGVASLLRHVDERGLGNVRIHPDDVRDLLERVPDAGLARVFILFPDPWPKARHHKRRLLQPDVIRRSSECCARRPTPVRDRLGELRRRGRWSGSAGAGTRLDGGVADDWRTPARRPRADAVRGEAPGRHRAGVLRFRPKMNGAERPLMRASARRLCCGAKE